MKQINIILSILSDDSDGELQIEENDETDGSSDSEASDNDDSFSNLGQHVSLNGVVWNTNPPPPRHLNRNIVDFQSGLRIVPKSEYESFSLFIDEIILRTIQRYTNRRMRARGKLPFTFKEVKADIGISYAPEKTTIICLPLNRCSIQKIRGHF